MSELLVPVCKIDVVKPHTNPEVHSLDIAEIGGWQCLVKRGTYKTGDKVVFFPPDTVIPESVSDKFGVTNYLNKGRVRTIRLKGEPSYGLIVSPDDPNWKIGKNVADYYQATKYMPPPPRNFNPTGKQSKVVKQHPLFDKYTDIANMRHYPNLFEIGEEVIATEKAHGTNSRIAYIDGQWMIGSKNLQRSRPTKLIPRKSSNKFINFLYWLTRRKDEIDDIEFMKKDWFWFPYTIPGLVNMISRIATDVAPVPVIVYGEVFGSVQTLHYGNPNGLSYAVFDIKIGQNYWDYNQMVKMCQFYGVPTAPEIYRGPFSLEKMKELSCGQSHLTTEKHIREGIVVRPIKERHHPKVGRLVLKYVGDDYLQGKEPDKKGEVKVSDHDIE